MPRYAVKIAEIQIVSDTPITEVERKEVLEMVRQGHAAQLLAEGIIEIAIRLQP